MKALTLWQPWASAIVLMGKRVENRSWQPPAWIIGQTVLIHAGKAWDPDATQWMADEGLDPEELRKAGIPLPRGFILGAARIVGWAQDAGRLGAQLGDYRIVGSPDERRAVATAAIDSPWFTGEVGWILDSVWRFAEPLECRGAQGLWDPPPAIVREASKRLQEAIRV